MSLGNGRSMEATGRQVKHQQISGLCSLEATGRVLLKERATAVATVRTLASSLGRLDQIEMEIASRESLRQAASSVPRQELHER